jgi:ABC-type transport system involved in multi-copper enzyme maturation permease subunit
MWYKEWTAIRFKFWMWLAVYLALALFFINFGYRYYIDGAAFDSQPSPRFFSWIGLVYFITILAALFGGTDMVAEETDKGTLEFLLTKPLTRQHIYTSKLLINILALGVAYGGPSLLLLIYDQFQRQPTPIFEALVLLLLNWLLGSAFICLTALLSVFANNSMNALRYSLLVITGVGLVAFTLLYMIPFDPNVSITSVVLCAYILLGALAVSFYRVGLFCFERRGF